MFFLKNSVDQDQFLFVLMLYIPFNNISVRSEQIPVFLGWTRTKQEIKCFARDTTQ